MGPDKERPVENTCRIVKGLDAVWTHLCPSKPCLPLSIDGKLLFEHNRKEDPSVPFSLIPRGFYNSVSDLDPQVLAVKGIRLVLADLDNTLVPYKVLTPAPEVADWIAGLKQAGIQLFLLSNSRKPGRAQQFAQSVGIPYQGHSGKPKRGGYLKAMERMGCTPGQTVMVGDQIFTDVLGANRSGVTPLLIRPIRLAGNPGRYLRYWGETPFRLLGKRRPFL